MLLLTQSLGVSDIPDLIVAALWGVAAVLAVMTCFISKNKRAVVGLSLLALAAAMRVVAAVFSSQLNANKLSEITETALGVLTAAAAIVMLTSKNRLSRAVAHCFYMYTAASNGLSRRASHERRFKFGGGAECSGAYAEIVILRFASVHCGAAACTVFKLYTQKKFRKGKFNNACHRDGQRCGNGNKHGAVRGGASADCAERHRDGSGRRRKGVGRAGRKLIRRSPRPLSEPTSRA